MVYSDIPDHTVPGGTLPPNILITSLKPDIVAVQDNNKSIMIIELTIPFEPNIRKAHERKEMKYSCLIDDLIEEGYNTQLYCIEVGSRGLISPDNERHLQSLFQASKRDIKNLKKDLSRISLLSNYTEWNAQCNQAWENCPYL